MRNILDQGPAPYEALTGRLRFSCDFVAGTDLRGKDILDVGCGWGWFELFAHARGARSVVGIEHTPADLETALRHVTLPGVTFKVGSATHLPFADHSIDTVVSWEVLEHIPKRTEPDFFREVARVLRPGGSFYLSTPAANPVSCAFDPGWLIGHRHYTLRGIRSLGKAAGLDCEEAFGAGGPWEIASWWNLYVAKWVFRRPPFMESFIARRTDPEFTSKGRRLPTNVFARFRKSIDAFG
jgi:ubiquinone/menaquinone biosynthesis C-methylase UbiE